MNKYTDMAYCSLYTLMFFLLMPVFVAAEDVADYKISSPISGIVKHIYVKQGQKVNKGDLLLEFDDTLVKGNFSEAKANMSLAKIKLTEAKKEQDRAKELYDIAVLSEHELQQAKVLYKQAIAHYEQAKNQHLHAQWDIKHSKLYAGFAGQISQLLIYPGQYINNQLTAQVLLIIKK